MGFLDRIKDVAGRARKRKPPEDLPPLTLDVDEQDRWVVQMIDHAGLDHDFKQLRQRVDDARTKLKETAKTFSDETKLTDIPERARTVNAVHGHELAQQAEKLLKQTEFSDLFTFDEDQQRFHAALEEFRDRTGKNISALKEFMKKQVDTVEEGVQEIENAVVGFLQVLDEKRFPQIERVHNALEELKKVDEKQERFRTHLGRLTERLQQTRQKQQKINEKINEQRKLIRNPAALQALDSLSKLEHELDETIHKHENTASDALSYYKKHAELNIPAESHEVLQQLPKHPSSYVAENPDAVERAFEVISDHLEQEGRGNLGNLIPRLQELSRTARKDAARAKEILPQQKELKQQIMRDVAAINIYDQQQFLLRANRMEKELEAKTAFIREQLTGGDRIALEREMKDAAKAFGAVVEGESLQDVREGRKMTTEEDIEKEISKEKKDVETKSPEEEAFEKEAKRLDDEAKHEEDLAFETEEAETNEEISEDEKTIEEAEDTLSKKPEELERELEDISFDEDVDDTA